jgi:hypothetical protein
MKSFAVRMAIDTPISLCNLLHLDAVLGSVVCRNGGAYGDLPLACTDGLWHASAALLETTAYGASDISYIRVKAVLDVPAAVLDTLPRSGRTIGPMSPYRPQLSQYPVSRGVKAVWFAGRGDGDAIRDILESVGNLGAMSHTGSGRVTGVELIEIADSNLSGIVLVGGLPARAMPLPRWGAFGLERPSDAVVSTMRWRGPYWDGPQALCIAPTGAMLRGTGPEIRRLISA